MNIRGIIMKINKVLNNNLVISNINGKERIVMGNGIAFGKKRGQKLDESKIEKIYNLYTSIGYKVIKTDAKNNAGVSEIKPYLKNNITAFSGNSGVGKSTLINALVGKNAAEEGIISSKNKRGKNTTTQVLLYKIETNSYLADTPGFSTFDINEIPKEDLAYYFVEFRPYLGKCEYADCSHVKEEKCGIKKAFQEGRISEERYNRYVSLWGQA